MTRAEIRANIQYNENLVYSYKRSIRELEVQINELCGLRRKIQTLESNFESRQNKRKNNLSKVLSGKLNVKMIGKYTSSMKRLLTGTEYTNARKGLLSAQERINLHIRSIQKEINELYDSIAYREGRIAYWRRQFIYAAD